MLVTHTRLRIFADILDSDQAHQKIKITVLFAIATS